mmetsp:Transcript_25543/g.77295  ORF Transcript_25543/g.77295 Transcript_25543/m.77295 type:complete len:211 (+) Transcript_25543:393-1025(+)
MSMRREGRATHRFHARIPRFRARNIYSLIYSRRTSGPTPVPCCFFADSQRPPARAPHACFFSLQPCGSSHSKGLGRPTEAEPLEPLPVVCRQRRHQPQGLVRCGVAHPQRVGVQQQPRARRVRLRACAVLRVSGDGAAGVLCVQPDLVHPPADGARLAQRGAVGALQHAKARERLLRSQRLRLRRVGWDVRAEPVLRVARDGRVHHEGVW